MKFLCHIHSTFNIQENSFVKAGISTKYICQKIKFHKKIAQIKKKIK